MVDQDVEHARSLHDRVLRSDVPRMDFNREGLPFSAMQSITCQAMGEWLWTYNNARPELGIGAITSAMKLKMAT